MNSKVLPLLGLFEDGAYRDCITAMMARQAEQQGQTLAIFECRANAMGHPLLLPPEKQAMPVWLELELEVLSGGFAGVLIGAGKGDDTRVRRIREIKKALSQRIELPLLVAVADPGLEAWLLADPPALQQVVRFDTVRGSGGGLHARLGDSGPDHALSRKPPRTLKLARQLLARTVHDLLGTWPLKGGVEYAAEVGSLLRKEHVSVERNSDLLEFLEEIPAFLDLCLASR